VLAGVTFITTLALSQWRIFPAVGLSIGIWLVAGGFVYLWSRIERGGGARLAKLFVLPLSVWSMSLAHIGAGVLTVGAIAETAFRAERAVALTPGEGVAFADRQVTLLAVGEVEGPNYSATRGYFRIEQNGVARPLSAERRFFYTSPTPTTEVGILSAVDGDLYIALGEPVRDQPGKWGVRLYHNPLVLLIFIGATMMALGGLLSLFAVSRRGRFAL
jgi:cytochrome c-type biogenesis protein CcmF